MLNINLLSLSPQLFSLNNNLFTLNIVLFMPNNKQKGTLCSRKAFGDKKNPSYRQGDNEGILPFRPSLRNHPRTNRGKS